MKGIRKLFFGLILMTLIGVGFKVDVKAEVTPFIVYNNGDEDNWEAVDTYLDGYITVDSASDFSIEGTEYKCQLFCDPANPYGISQEVTIILKDNGDGTYSYENTTTGLVDSNCGSNPTIHFYNKPSDSGNEVIRNGISSHHLSDKPSTISETVFSGVKIGSTYSYSKDNSLGNKSENVKLSKVLGGVYEGSTCKYALNCITKDSDDNTYNHSVQTPDNYVYLFPKENVTFKKSNTPATPYQYIAWTWDSGDTNFGAFITGSEPDSAGFQMKTTSTYIKARYGILTFDSTIKANRGSANTNPVTYSLLGYKNGNKDISKVEIETSSGTYTDVTTGTYWTPTNPGMGETGTFKITTLPTSLSVGSYPLRITMKSDAGVGGGVFNSTIEIINDEKEIVLNDVKVTNSKSITLDNFIKSTSAGSSGTSVKAELYGNAGQYVSSSDLNALKVISSIAVTGTNTTTGVEGIRVSNEGGTNSAKVIVYPLPSIALASGSSNTGTISLGSNSTSSSSSTNAFTVTMPGAVYHSVPGGNAITMDKVTYAELTLKGSSKKVVDPEFSMGNDAGTKSKSVTVKELTSILKDICDGSSDDVTITAAPKEEKGTTADSYVAASETMKVYRVKLDRSGGATYSVKVGSTELISTSDTTEYFYAIKGLNYSIKSTAKNSGEKFQKWDNDNNKNWDTADGGEFEADGSKTFKAIYSNSSSSSPSSSSPSTTGRNAATAGEGMDDYDDVPKTGESKADIWILWSVLFVSILGAGFMIWKRFGLVHAIAEADEEVAVAEHKEEVKAKKKEKEDKIKMLKDLRNL